MKYTIASFYKFFKLGNLEELKIELLNFCKDNSIFGTILIANEGVNATITGEDQSVKNVINYIEKLSGPLNPKYSYSEKMTFKRMKVKIKKEIVKIGLADIDPNKKVGTYVSSDEWNKLISDPSVKLIDTRNDYEYQVGTFKGAINPQTDTFCEFPEYVSKNLDPSKDEKVALFCTGGIRCEKATSYMLENGFKEVFHLEGGILDYLEKVDQAESLWDGECYVFDDRVSVEHQILEGTYSKCSNCGMPVSPEERLSPKYEEEISCINCFDEMTPQRRASRQMRKDQLLAKRETSIN